MNLNVKCQKIYDIKTKQELYSEVLVRNCDDIKGADNIIKYAHDNGICAELDEQIISYTLNLIKELLEKGKTYAFNLCDKTLEVDGEADRIIEIIGRLNTAYNKIWLEVTEDTDFNNATVMDNINKLTDSGIKVILDDFGKRNSNIEALLRIKFSIVKIDKEYIQEAIEKRRQLKVLVGVIGLLDNLNITTVVEGVETLEHLKLADTIGANAVQGYYMHRPEQMEAEKRHLEAEKRHLEAVENH